MEDAQQNVKVVGLKEYIAEVNSPLLLLSCAFLLSLAVVFLALSPVPALN